MNKIQKEQIISKQEFEFHLLKDKKYKSLVEISVRNVALAEAMIRTDSSYFLESIKAAPEKSERKGKYGGSMIYHVERLRDIIDNKIYADDKTWKDTIRAIVVAVDKANSTHLNSDGVGVEQITERICKIDRKKLVEMVRNPREDDYELIKIITEKTVVPKEDKKHHARTNYSFATKFCRALCMTLFEGEEEQDNFSIYDYVIAEAIWYYVDYYNINAKKNDLKDYAKFINIIDQIIEKSDREVSRNGFDHLIWYYYKGKPKEFFR